MLIVIEGIDGSGKTTQARRLADSLKKRGVSVHMTHQPSNHRIGELVRDALHGVFPVENDTIALLFAADRVQHYHEEIAPALAAGKTVICDRYYYSNLVYQGGTPDAFARVCAYNRLIMSMPPPTHVFFLDVAPKLCMDRLEASRKADGERKAISIYEDISQLRAMRARYFQVFKTLGVEPIIVTMENIAQHFIV